MSSTQFISFKEIVRGRDCNVRVTPEGLVYAVDLSMVMSGKSRDDAGKTLRNLSDEVFSSEKFTEKNTGGSGNNKTKLLTMEHAIELVMVLPGKVAKETRVQFANIIQRYMAGKESLVDEIRVNAASNSPLAQLARTNDLAPEDDESRRKRIKREDLELINLEQEIQEKRIKNLNSFMELMSRINPSWMQTDARFRLQTEDMVKNILTPPGSVSLAITNHGETQSQPLSLSISQLAQELGCKRLSHADSCRAGALAAKRYRAMHDNADPPKHRQWVEGAERQVNSYTEADREMLTGVLVDLGLLPGSSSSSSSVASSHDD
jgi:hypothetical protein